MASIFIQLFLIPESPKTGVETDFSGIEHEFRHFNGGVAVLLERTVEIWVLYGKIGAPLNAGVAKLTIVKKYRTTIFNHNI